MRSRSIRALALFVGVVSSAAWVAACSSGSDTTTAPPATTPSVQGDWTFTLTSADSTKTGDTATVSHVLVIDTGGVLVGTGDRFRFDGVRRDAQVSLNVYSPQGKDQYVRQTTMYLTLAGDTLSGGGVFFHPTLDPLVNPDGSPDAKDTTANADSLILDGSELYTVRGVRTGPLSASMAALVREGKSFMPATAPNRDFASGICSMFSSISSFFIGKMTNGLFRPMSSCYGEWDGGGYYLFGRVGPGSITPMFTETFYQPQEWVPCTVRSYSFQISIEGTATGTSVLNQYYMLDPAWWLGPQLNATNPPNLGFGITLDEWANQLYQLTGGYAISLAHSEYSNNWSMYVNTVNGGLTYDQIYTSPLPNLIVNTLLGLAGPGHVFAHYGRVINDHWNLKRAPWGIPCSTPLDIIYLFGTNNVTYN